MNRSTVALIGAVILFASQSLATAALADTAEILESECHKQLQLGDSGCACIGERAEAELNEKQQALVVASIQDDDAGSMALRSGMTQEEMMGAAQFMMETPELCASQ